MAELVKALSAQTSELARKEVELAKAELAVKGKRIGIGAGAFGGAAVLGIYALGALTATLILLLATAMTGWVAALIVTVAYGAIAGGLALMGKSKVDDGTPVMPERAFESTKEDVEVAKRSAKEGRS